MKKSTIKRRKRVVPAYPDQNARADSPSQGGNSPVSPHEDQMEPSVEMNEATQSVKRVRLPPIVDFTGYRPDTTNPAAYKEVLKPRQSPNAPTFPGPSLAPTSEDYAIQAQLAAAAASDGMQLDPALRPRLNQQPPQMPSPSLAAESRERWKAERRLTLMREAEMMRAALRQKEREIDELNS